MLQTICKIGPVLDLFTDKCADWGVAEVASALEMPRSSAHALLSSLADTGLLRSGGRGRYRIGWRVVELGETLRGSVDVRSFARPVMQELALCLGETVNLVVWDRGRALYVEKVAGHHPVSVLGVRVGAKTAAHACAAGKVLLTHRDPAEIRRYLAHRQLRALTRNTLSDPAALNQELHKVRASGCAIDAGETVAEVHCVAAPVKDDFGSVVAALSVTASASRFLPRVAELKRAAIRAAGELSTSLAAAAREEINQR